MTDWITCWDCQGDEGQIIDGEWEWVDCPCCQGEGGHPEGKTWSCSCTGKEGQ